MRARHLNDDDSFGDELADVSDAAELLKSPYTPPKFVVEHLVPEKRLILFTGDTGAAKTAFLYHLAVCVATNNRVAKRFSVSPTAGPALILNGEMGAESLHSFVHQAAVGLQVQIPKGRLYFHGIDGVATFQDDARERARLQRLIRHLSPSIVIFDTQRAMFTFDENSAAEVREAYRWLHSLCRYGCAVLVAHHLRKQQAQGANSARERVSGSRDQIAAVDVQISAISRDGRPMTALHMGKTRTPFDGVAAGTEWPVIATLEPGNSGTPASLFEASEPNRRCVMQTPESAAEMLLALLKLHGPMTLKAMGATGGTRKRAYEQLRDAALITTIGKVGRSTTYGIPGMHDVVLSKL